MNIRTQILNYLEQNGPSTALLLSQSLDRTVADIRYQLKNLLFQKLIHKTLLPQSYFRGRPAAWFALVDSFPEMLYKRLIRGLFGTVTNFANDEQTRKGLVNQISDALIYDFQPVGSPAVRMNQMVSFLEQLGIKVKWEAGKTGPKVLVVKETLSDLTGNPELSIAILIEAIRKLIEKAAGDHPTA
ncbi:MAG: hypothetical protein FD147_51 [Chloroflexi bacterium]|nr:MAG: hypothetical protein FD147_51 [Chloroflexota bacterium]MBA4374678.1 hypothetical protein [Anaerolinea sp.]